LGFFSLARKNTQVGVDYLPNGLAVVQVKTSGDSAGKIIRQEFIEAQNAALQNQALHDWVNQHGLQKTPCICLIKDDDCDINQIEKPNVDESELIQALTWKVKDLVSYDIDSAVVDVYPMPPSNKNNTHQVSVVSAEHSVVAGYVQSINSSGLKLKAIDIHDLARKNLPSIRNSVENAQAVLFIGEQFGELSIFHDTDLYVSRRFKIGSSKLQLANSEDQSVYDELLLEIQRSMDYYESYYGLGSVRLMEIFPRTPVTEKMALYLQNLTGFEIDFLQTHGENDQSSELQPLCFDAYCASLRGVAL
jgi:MSHA biogenesis protein MshI